MSERYLPMRQPLGRNKSNVEVIIRKHEDFLSKNRAAATSTNNVQSLQNEGRSRKEEAASHLERSQRDDQRQARKDRGAEQKNYIPPSAIPVQRNDEVFAAERALIKRFDPITSTWQEGELMIQINRKPFADGSMRAAYKMKVLSGMDVRGSERQWVAKLSKDPREDPRQYAKDVEMQMEARIWADQVSSGKTSADLRTL
jgi:hypothetical protein